MTREVVVESGAASRSEPLAMRLRGLLGNQQVILFLVLVAMVVFFTVRESIFFSQGVFENILSDWAPLVLIAVGETFVIVNGGIDLSVGANLGLSGVVAALAMRGLTRDGSDENLTLLVGLVVAMGVGLGVGLVNAFLINKAKIVPFIATLATLGVASGMSVVLTKGGPVGGGPSNAIPQIVPRYWAFSKGVLVVVAVVLVLTLVLHLTRFGRHTFAIGSNPFAARAAGINVQRHITKVYALSGVLAGLAGMFFYLRLSAGAPSTGAGKELDAIAAVVIGGAALSGGVGRISGTVLGAFMFTTVYSGLVIIGMDPNYKSVVVGVLIAVAAAIQSLRTSEARAS
jgi:ribose transport system permease protein